MARTFVIIDGSSLIHRAFYALPPLTTASGQHTNAVYGFANMLIKLLADIRPDAVVVALDKGKTTFRNQIYADYKGQRKAMPVELAEQLNLYEELLNAFGIAKIGLEGFEADDVIGTLADKASASGFAVTIVTGDKDALQLITPTVKVLLTKKGISELDLMDETAFIDRYGITPDRFADVKSLMGDQSDNIPGIAGIGEKTALKLIQEFGSLENLLSHVDEVSGKKTQELLRSQMDNARLSQQLAKIVQNVPIAYDPDAYEWKPDAARLQELFLQLEFRNMFARLKPILPDCGQVVEIQAEALPPAEGLRDDADARHLLEQIASSGLTVLPQSSGHIPNLELTGMAVAVAERTVFLTPSSPGWGEVLHLLTVPTQIKSTHDAKHLINIGRSDKLSFSGLDFDSLLAAYLLDPAASQYSLPDLATTYLGRHTQQWKEAELTQDPRFAVWGVGIICNLRPVMEEKIKAAGLHELYQTVEMPLTRVLSAMEMNGIAIDQTSLVNMSGELAIRIEQLLQEIYAIAGEAFNVNSTKQLGAVLFEKLGLPAMKKTKTGYSTDASVLEKLSGQHRIIDNLLEYRMLAKLKSTYLDGMSMLVSGESNRIHTTFNQTVTTTGRLSSSDPNLQNIPVRTDTGRRIRELFVPGEGWDYILSADYSQIELRVLAHMSKDENLIDAFCKGQDIHTRTAAEVFGVPMAEVTGMLRSRAKAVNFGIVYGISDFGLSRDTGVSRKEAEHYIESYFSRYPGVKQFMNQSVETARQHGYVTTLFGRRRYLPDINAANFSLRSFAERTAMNTPIQGTAADIIKKAMVDVYERLLQAGMKSRILLQVHDELLLEVVADEADSVCQIVREAMEGAAALSVPLVTDIKWGKSWAAAK